MPPRRTPSRPGSKHQGFTLLEMSIVLIITSTLLAGGITGFIAYFEKKAYQSTERQMQAIEQALIQYRKVFGRIPCPSDITQTTETATFGNELGDKGVCTGGANLVSGDMVTGMVPTRTLGLNDEYAFDSWGRRIRYQVDRRYTEEQGFLTYQANPSTPYSLAYIGTDTRTQGNWIGKYGADGYYFAKSDAPPISNPPAYGTLTINAPMQMTDWATVTTGDVRALLYPGEAINRIAACWFRHVYMNLEISITDGKRHAVRVYMLDWDTDNTRSTNLLLQNAAGTVTYDTQFVSNYKNGKYIGFVVDQSVRIRMQHVGGGNSTISAVFFDPPDPNTPVYSLISHGQNGHGGYPRGGGAGMFNAGSVNLRELVNCNCSSSAAYTRFSGIFEYGIPTENPANALDNFDDIVVFKRRGDLN